jgi:predicted membrane protein
MLYNTRLPNNFVFSPITFCLTYLLQLPLMRKVKKINRRKNLKHIVMDFESREKIRRNHSCAKDESLPVFGLVLVGLGFVYLLAKLGVLDGYLKDIIISWPTLLIFIGSISLIRNHSRLPGLVLILVGSALMLPKIFPDSLFDREGLVWPLLLIAVGLLIVFKARKIHHPHVFFNPETINNAESFEEVAIFGGGKRIITTQTLKSGKVNAIFGGIELDLTQADFEGDSATIEVSCIFGGVTVFVRPEWDVQIQVASVMGGFTDKRNMYRTPNTNGKHLIIKGGVVFGGGELKTL